MSIEAKIKEVLNNSKLNDDKTVIEFPVVTSLTSNGKEFNYMITVYVIEKQAKNQKKVIIQEWFNSKIELPKNYVCEILVNKWTDADQLHEVVPTIITTGKNLGKANATNVFTQALLDAYSKHKKYVDSRGINQKNEEVALYPPMLAKLRNDVEVIDPNHIYDTTIESERIFIQPKFNGVRMIITLSGDDDNNKNTIITYSRNLKIYNQFSYLNDEAVRFIKEGERLLNEQYNLNLKLYLDGEAYKHGISLQDISGFARKKTISEKDIKLDYYNYDCFIYNGDKEFPMNFEKRNGLLSSIYENISPLTYLKQVDTILISKEKEIPELYNKFLEEKYEGAMIRKNSNYVHSFKHYHSSVLLKIKPKLDSEFELVGFIGADKGKAKDCIVWVCATETGETFNTTPLGTIEERKQLFYQMSEIVNKKTKQTYFDANVKGKMITILYDELSDSGVPLRGNSSVIRDYEG